MNYRGRAIDPLSVWSHYVEFPNVRIEESDIFAPKVQCPNPAHDTLKRHFQINLSQPTVHCFAHCGISGSWEHAICVIEGLYEKFKVEEAPDERERARRKSRALRQARKIILRSAITARVKADDARSIRKSSTAKNSRTTVETVRRDELRYESFLPARAAEYLSDREIDNRSIAKWKLGWLPEERRIAIPAHDEHGKLRFLIKRGISPKQQPKYLYTEGFPKSSLLFGACELDLGMVHSDGLIVVEGSLDVIKFHQHGLRNTGGILGTGISEAQRRVISKLRPSRITLAFDKDSAGIRNIEIAAGVLRKYPLYVMKFPKGKNDPAELTEEEAYRQVSRAVPALRFIRENHLNVSRKERNFSFG